MQPIPTSPHPATATVGQPSNPNGSSYLPHGAPAPYGAPPPSGPPPALPPEPPRKRRRWPIALAIFVGLVVLGSFLPDSDTRRSSDTVADEPTAASDDAAAAQEASEQAAEQAALNRDIRALEDGDCFVVSRLIQPTPGAEEDSGPILGVIPQPCDETNNLVVAGYDTRQTDEEEIVATAQEECGIATDAHLAANPPEGPVQAGLLYETGGGTSRAVRCYISVAEAAAPPSASPSQGG